MDIIVGIIAVWLIAVVFVCAVLGTGAFIDWLSPNTIDNLVNEALDKETRIDYTESDTLGGR